MSESFANMIHQNACFRPGRELCIEKKLQTILNPHFLNYNSEFEVLFFIEEIKTCTFKMFLKHKMQNNKLTATTKSKLVPQF